MLLTKGDKIFGAISHTVLILISIICVIPFLLLISSSFTDENALLNNGYALLPSKFSLAAYQYLGDSFSTIASAYGITVLVTLIGTTASIVITAMLAYPLSRKDLPKRKFFMFFVVFTMLFNGGLVPSYLMWTQVFQMKDSLAAYILPGLLTNAFFIILMKTYFENSIPTSLIEAAQIDGANEAIILFKIVMPLALPIVATLGLFSGLNYWNDWMNGLIYISDSHKFSIQVLLNQMLQDIQTLSSGVVKQSVSTSAMPASGVRMAIAVIAALPIMVIYPFFQKYFQKGIMVGAVKG
ncbi:carbohydrate ABC transporter permease [Caproicibacterium sp. XB1]